MVRLVVFSSLGGILGAVGWLLAERFDAPWILYAIVWSCVAYMVMRDGDCEETATDIGPLEPE